jgi:hypothetical protein
MKKGTQAPAPMSKPVEGSKAGDKVTGGKVYQPFAGTPKPGKIVSKKYYSDGGAVRWTIIKYVVQYALQIS